MYGPPGGWFGFDRDLDSSVWSEWLIDWKRSLVGCHKGLLSTKHWERVETNKVVVDKHSQPKDRHPSPIKKGKKGNLSKI